MKNLLVIFICCFAITTQAQIVKIDGYAYESGNRGYLNQVEVKLIDPLTDDVLQTVYSDIDGHFVLEATGMTDYKLICTKELFHDFEIPVSLKSKTEFIKAEMKRAPGYIFEITMAEKREEEGIAVDAIRGALIEVYNNTTKKEIMVLKDHPHPDFKLNMNKGNHYTIMIRKEGYLAKRMEAFVNVQGCILCFEGIGDVQPGVSDNLTEGNLMGTLLANVELEKLYEGKKMQIDNIYYDLNKANIRPDAAKELDKVILFLKDNPRLNVSLGSHTDARGTSESNMNLSQRRAKSAAEYLIMKGDMDKKRISYVGYGETQIINRCTNGVECTDQEHEQNRRTELEILEITADEGFKSLLQMKKDEEMEALILELTNQEIIEVPKDAPAPPTDEDKIDEEPLFEDHDELEETSIEKKESNPEIKEKIDGEHVEIEEQPVFEDHEVVEEIVEVKDDILEEPQVLVETSEISLKNKGINGHKIVIHFTNIPLPKDHEIFEKHAQVDLFYTENKNILYLVGEFDTRSEAENFLKNVLSNDYPNAYVASFENGIRIRD